MLKRVIPDDVFGAVPDNPLRRVAREEVDRVAQLDPMLRKLVSDE